MSSACRVPFDAASQLLAGAPPHSLDACRHMMSTELAAGLTSQLLQPPPAAKFAALGLGSEVNKGGCADPATTAAALTADLHSAAERGNAQGVLQLLALGADPNARGRLKTTSLHAAAQAAHGACAVVPALLAAGAKLSTRDAFGGTPLHHAGRAPSAIVVSHTQRTDFCLRLRSTALMPASHPPAVPSHLHLAPTPRPSTGHSPTPISSPICSIQGQCGGHRGPATGRWAGLPGRNGLRCATSSRDGSCTLPACLLLLLH